MCAGLFNCAITSKGVTGRVRPSKEDHAVSHVGGEQLQPAVAVDVDAAGRWPPRGPAAPPIGMSPRLRNPVVDGAGQVSGTGSDSGALAR